MSRYITRVAPGIIRCACGWRGSSNALAREAHLRGNAHLRWQWAHECRGQAKCCEKYCPNLEEGQGCPYDHNEKGVDQ